jgi:hypothetical protein
MESVRLLNVVSMRKTNQQTPNRICFVSTMAIAAILALAPGCELDVTDGELAALEEQAAADGLAGSVDVSPAHHEGPGTSSNWYVTGPRTGEQGTHGAIGPGDCPAGSAVVGVQYFEGGNSDWVDGIGVACWGPTVGFFFSNWYSGGIRGSEQGTHGTGMGLCPWGKVVTGVQYFDSADWVDGLGVECGSPRTVSNWFPDVVTGEQGVHSPVTMDCPNGLVVVGLQAFSGTTPGFTEDWVDGIGVHCGDRPAGWPTP